MQKAVLFSLLILRLSFAQAELTGEVLDPSGVPIAQASVTLMEVDTNATFHSTSAIDGRYRFTGVRPGRYNLTVEASGFQRVTRQGVMLLTGEKVRLDFVLSIGSVQENLSITADAPLLRTESGDIGQVIDNKKIVELPLNGRSFISLAALAPVVALPPGSAFPASMAAGRVPTNFFLTASRYCNRNPDRSP